MPFSCLRSHTRRLSSENLGRVFSGAAYMYSMYFEHVLSTIPHAHTKVQTPYLQ